MLSSVEVYVTIFLIVYVLSLLSVALMTIVLLPLVRDTVILKLPSEATETGMLLTVTFAIPDGSDAVPLTVIKSTIKFWPSIGLFTINNGGVLSTSISTISCFSFPAASHA